MARQPEGMPAQECAEAPRTGGVGRGMDWPGELVSSGRSESMVSLPSRGPGNWAGAGGGRARSLEQAQWRTGSITVVDQWMHGAGPRATGRHHGGAGSRLTKIDGY